MKSKYNILAEAPIDEKQLLRKAQSHVLNSNIEKRFFTFKTLNCHFA